MANNTNSQPAERLFMVVELLAENRLPIRLIDIAQKLGLPQSTVLRYLRTLCGLGYVYHDEDLGLYALTWKICRISDSVKANLVMRNMASPFLSNLSNTLGMGSCLVIRRDLGTVYLDFYDNPRGEANTMLRIGQNAPIHSTSSGKVLLAALSDREITNIVEKVGLPKLTPNTITNIDVLMHEIENVRKLGYSIDHEECEEGHKCLSVPLYDYSGNVAAAISVFDDAQNFPDERIEEILPMLQQAAKEISFRLGYDK